jgi:hypothetical protein
MERTAKPVPKPCYALEFDLRKSMCQECEFQRACYEDLGMRQNRITLDKVVFKLVPTSYGLTDIDMGDDPELPHLENLYLICHETVFGCQPHDSVRRHKAEIIAKFRQAKNTSMRLFMLANMVAHQQWEITVAERMNRKAKNWFHAKLLTSDQAITRLDAYRDMCRKAFGSFDIGSLSLLTDGEYEKTDIEKKMLHSEITAARRLVQFKIGRGGPGLEHLYHWEELTLDPYWLATEPTYMETVLKPHLAGKKGTRTINNHRHSVTQVIAEMKRKRDWGIAIFQARERVMQSALGTVLHQWGFDRQDFEFDQETVENVMDFWAFVGRAIQHVHCLRYVDGEDETLRV